MSATCDGVSNEVTIDLHGEPLTFQSLHMLLETIAGGWAAVHVVNGARESAEYVMHRLALQHIAQHEARVRSERERYPLVRY
jgi:hypothetical protein